MQHQYQRITQQTCTQTFDLILLDDDDDTTTDEIPFSESTTTVQYHIDTFQQPSSQYATLEAEEVEREEDFQTVLLNDEH